MAGKVEAGIDKNKNGTLDQAEVQETKWVCHGNNGTSIDQLRFKVFAGVGASSATPYTHIGDLIKFDIRNFSEMDSAIFVVEEHELRIHRVV